MHTTTIRITGHDGDEVEAYCSQWFHVSDATVYDDHPVHAMAEHTLDIDLADPTRGPGQRVAVELTRESATHLRDAIDAALTSAPEGV